MRGPGPGGPPGGMHGGPHGGMHGGPRGGMHGGPHMPPPPPHLTTDVMEDMAGDVWDVACILWEQLQ